MEESKKIMLVKAKGDRNWSIRILENSPNKGVYYLLKFFETNEELEYIEFKPCCCIIERIIPLKAIEKYGITREELSEDMIIR